MQVFYSILKVIFYIKYVSNNLNINSSETCITLIFLYKSTQCLKYKQKTKINGYMLHLADSYLLQGKFRHVCTTLKYEVYIIWEKVTKIIITWTIPFFTPQCPQSLNMNLIHVFFWHQLHKKKSSKTNTTKAKTFSCLLFVITWKLF